MTIHQTTIQNRYREAAQRARMYAHGSYYHQRAMQILYDGFYVATGDRNPSLAQLWAWVNEQYNNG